MSNAVLENVFGTISLVFWTIQLLPQIYHTFRRKSTLGSSVGMMLLWFMAGVFLCPYSIYKQLSIPLILQAHIFAFLCVVCVLQDVYYDSSDNWSRLFSPLVPQTVQSADAPVTIDGSVDAGSDEFVASPVQDVCSDNQLIVNVNDDPDGYQAHGRRRRKFGWDTLIRLSIVTLILTIVWAAIEIGFLAWLWNTHSEQVLLALALLSGLSTLIGFIPQYYVVIRAKSTRGLSVLFIVIDMLGGMFGIISLIFKEGPFDVMTSLIYLAVCVGDFGLIIMKGVYYKNDHLPAPTISDTMTLTTDAANNHSDL